MAKIWPLMGFRGFDMTIGPLIWGSLSMDKGKHDESHGGILAPKGQTVQTGDKPVLSGIA
jgi:hypothetical protein